MLACLASAVKTPVVPLPTPARATKRASVARGRHAEGHPDHHRQPHRQAVRAADRARRHPRDRPRARSRSTPDDSGLDGLRPRRSSTPRRARASITFIDGDRGILRYRGYPIEELAEHSSYLETAYLIVKGELPDHDALPRCGSTTSRSTRSSTRTSSSSWTASATTRTRWASWSAPIGALSTFYPDAKQRRRSRVAPPADAAPRSARCRPSPPSPTATAAACPTSIPTTSSRYTGNFLAMLFKMTRAQLPARPGPRARARRALHPARRPRAELLDERGALGRQLASRSVLGGRRRRRRRSTDRSTAAPTRQVIRMLREIGSVDTRPGGDQARSRRGEGRLMGFGHRVYKNYDPRGKIIKKLAYEVLRGDRQEPAHRHRASSSSASRCRTTTSSSASSIRTSTSTRASSTRRWASRCTMFPVLFAIARTVGLDGAVGRDGRATRSRRSAGPRQLYVGEGRAAGFRSRTARRARRARRGRQHAHLSSVALAAPASRSVRPAAPSAIGQRR